MIVIQIIELSLFQVMFLSVEKSNKSVINLLICCYIKMFVKVMLVKLFIEFIFFRFEYVYRCQDGDWYCFWVFGCGDIFCYCCCIYDIMFL